VLAAIGNHDNAVWKSFTNRAQAVKYCIVEEDDSRPEVDTAKVLRLMFTMRSSKANTDGNLRRFCVERRPCLADGTQSAETELLEDLVAFLKVAGFQECDREVPFFSRLGPSLQYKKLNRYMVSKAVKDAAVHFGFDPRHFSSHCHRIGAASVLSEEGFSEEEIKKYGGWSGNSHKLYEVSFAQRPSVLRITQHGGGVSMNDIRSLAPSTWAKEWEGSQPVLLRSRLPGSGLTLTLPKKHVFALSDCSPDVDV
jgi:hypothetical protein